MLTPRSRDLLETPTSDRTGRRPSAGPEGQRAPGSLRSIVGAVSWGEIALVLAQVAEPHVLEEQEEWHARWTTLGHAYEGRARFVAEMEAHGGGSSSSGAPHELLLKAAACHHYAQLPYFDNPEAKFATRRQVSRLFLEASPGLPHTSRRLRVPYRDSQLPAWLLTPGAGERRPCVLLVNDVGSSKEVELYTLAREFLGAGLSVLLFDGPGQGELAGLSTLPVAFEQVVGRVLARLVEAPEVDPGRLGVCGLGFGGYLAARAAALHRRTVRACISISGTHDHDDYPQRTGLERAALRYAFGVPHDAAMARLAHEALSLRGVPPLEVPFLVVRDPRGSPSSMEGASRLAAWARGDTKLVSCRASKFATGNMGRLMASFLRHAED